MHLFTKYKYYMMFILVFFFGGGGATASISMVYINLYSFHIWKTVATATLFEIQWQMTEQKLTVSITMYLTTKQTSVANKILPIIIEAVWSGNNNVNENVIINSGFLFKTNTGWIKK